MTLHRVYTICPSLLENIEAQLAEALCDRDPGVVSASLHLFYNLVKVSSEVGCRLKIFGIVRVCLSYLNKYKM